MKHDIIVREPELYFDSIHQELDNFLMFLKEKLILVETLETKLYQQDHQS